MGELEGLTHHEGVFFPVRDEVVWDIPLKTGLVPYVRQQVERELWGFGHPHEHKAHRNPFEVLANVRHVQLAVFAEVVGLFVEANLQGGDGYSLGRQEREEVHGTWFFFKKRGWWCHFTVWQNWPAGQ